MNIKPKTAHASPFEDDPGPSGWKPTRKRAPPRAGATAATPDGDPARAADEKPTTGIAPRGSVTSRKI